MSKATDVKEALQALASEERAAISRRFFKTGPSEYGEGDVFIGVTMPQLRKVAKKYKELPLQEAIELLHSEVHEHRMAALVIMTHRFEEGNEREVYDAYLENRKHINNWDLVDLSAPNIVGKCLLDKDRSILYRLAKGSLWEKRIAILATFTFIRNGESEDTLKLAKLYLSEEHDLTHKATGWMLREVGKRVGQEKEEEFLKKYYREMPRTMLRYAIERFSEPLRKKYLNGEV